MAPKRVGRPAKSNSPAAKRTKKAEPKADPVTEKVQVLVDAFNDEHQVRLVASELTDPCLDMLRSSIASSLGVGSAKDERHAFQMQVADLIGEVFQKVVKRWEAKVEEAASNRAKIVEEKAEKVSALEAAQAVREEKCSTVKEKKEILSEATQSVSAAKQTFAGAQGEFDEADAQKIKKEEEKAKVSSLLSEFEILKAGEFENSTAQKQAEKKLVSPLNAFLKGLKVDGSLLSAFPSAIGKKSSERGAFDNMVLNSIDEHVRKQVAELDDFLENFEKIKQEREAAVTDATNSLEKAEAHMCSCKDAVEAAKSEQGQAETALKDAKDAVKVEDLKLIEAESQEEINKKFLSTASTNMEAFSSLYERTVLVDPKQADQIEQQPLREPAVAGA